MLAYWEFIDEEKIPQRTIWLKFRYYKSLKKLTHYHCKLYLIFYIMTYIHLLCKGMLGIFYYNFLLYQTH